MTYVDSDGVKKHPVVIHRSSIGCYERTLAMMIEKYNGSFPTWLSPTQAVVLPISEKFNDYAAAVVKRLQDANIRATGDYRGEKIGFKIREARGERIPYILVVGEKEAENQTVSMRSRGGDEGETAVEKLIERISDEIKNRTLNITS
jgi:threonyl-tRNA synthetase